MLLEDLINAVYACTEDINGFHVCRARRCSRVSVSRASRCINETNVPRSVTVGSAEEEPKRSSENAKKHSRWNATPNKGEREGARGYKKPDVEFFCLL